MPIYEFECQKCRHRFEKILRMSDDPKMVACPVCPSKKTKKLPSLFGGRVGDRPLAGGGGCGTCAATSCSPT